MKTLLLIYFDPIYIPCTKKILKHTVNRLKMKRKVLIALLLKVNEKRMQSKRKIVYTPMIQRTFVTVVVVM